MGFETEGHDGLEGKGFGMRGDIPEALLVWIGEEGLGDKTLNFLS